MRVGAYTPELLHLVKMFNTARELWHHAGSYGGDPARMIVMAGPKYIRLVWAEIGADGCETKSCAGFVDRATGDILYAAGWRGPTKRVRGNVFAGDGGRSAVQWYGVSMAEDVSMRVTGPVRKYTYRRGVHGIIETITDRDVAEQLQRIGVTKVERERVAAILALEVGEAYKFTSDHDRLQVTVTRRE